MRLIHCADIHLDSKLSANLDKIKAKERKHEILATFSRMVDYAKDNSVDAILICGDLFDTHNVSALSRNTICKLVEENRGISFFYLRGNHDDINAEELFEEIPGNFYSFNDSWKEYKLSEKVSLYGVELNNENSASAQHTFSPNPSNINIVMLHGQETEAKAGDKSEIISLKEFRNKGIDYLALGHVHEHKSAMLDGRCKYCYSGCLEGRGFDETGEHGFVLLDIDEDTERVTDTFIPFAQRRLWDVYADVSGFLNTPDIITAVREALSKSKATRDDLVKVILSGKVDVSCEKDTDFIKNNFDGEYYFFKVYDKTVIKVNPEEFMYDSSLKGEFVRNVLNDESLTEDEKGRIVKIGLSVLMGGAI